MPHVQGKKALLLCLLDILKAYTDDEHPMTIAQFIQKLDALYGLKAERKAVSRNLALLVELGYDISPYDENGRGYYLRQRLLDDSELRLLMDCVLSSRFIPPSDAARLLEKLKQMSTVYFAGKMEHIQSVHQWHHQRNRQFFFNIDQISDAISRRRQIAFRYNRIGVDKKLHPVRTERDIVNPYQMVCTNGQYYLVCNFDGYDDLRHLRVDRMTDVGVQQHPRRSVRDLPGYEKGLRIADYIASHNLMVGGEPRLVRMRMHAACAADVVDAFGDKAVMKPLDDVWMEVQVTTALEGMRYFALQYGRHCQVIYPPELRRQVQQDIVEIAAAYGCQPEKDEQPASDHLQGGRHTGA